MKNYYIYFMASKNNNAIYVGVTNDLERRVYEHKNSLVEGFTKRYKCSKLIYFEISNSIESAILREKQLKRWSRMKKLDLIRKENAGLLDLSTSLEMTVK